MNNETPKDAAIVSCDIIGHGLELDHVRQLQRIRGLNNCVRQVCERFFGKGIVWASGGDGGHVAFLDESLRGLVLQLIRYLFLWAEEVGQQDKEGDEPRVKLRLTAHYGPVSIIGGADEREQLVGDGINFCGSLLNFGTPGAVVVSSTFKDFVDGGRGQGNDLLERVRFHDEQNVYLKHFVAHRLYFMSIDDEFISQRGFPEKSDRIKLREACDRKRYWQIIYHAKRLLQVNSADEGAKRALEAINPKQLTIMHDKLNEFEPHPLLAQMNQRALGDFIDAAHLIERDDGEMICEHQDSGDTMFIVLMGQVGVVMKRDGGTRDEGECKQPLDLRYGEGKILGELALALQRERTATLQAVGPTALLSINYHTMRSLLNAKPKNLRIERSFETFLRSRILEHICRQTTYLSHEEGGPLASIKEPWESLVDDSERIVLPWDEIEILSPDESPFNLPGLYILTSGRLTEASQSDNALKVLDGHNLPLLFVHLPNFLVSLHHQYRIDPNAPSETSKTITIMRISDGALKDLGPLPHAHLVRALKRQLSAQFLFDVFISYNHHDEPITRLWYDAMKKAQLRVYISETKAMQMFKTEIKVALADSLVMVPFISSQTLGTDIAESWVQREIRVRKMLFDEDHCNILPIELTTGIAAQLADGFSAISVSGSGQEAIEKAIEAIRAVQTGERPLPYATRRLTTPVF